MKELDRLLALATLQHTALTKLMRGVHAVAEPVLAMNYGVQALLVGCMRVRPHSFSLALSASQLPAAHRQCRAPSFCCDACSSRKAELCRFAALQFEESPADWSP